MTQTSDDSPSARPAAPADPIAASPAKSRRGFASLSPERRRAVAASGGASVLPANRSFSRSPALAASAGSKGGKASHGGGRKPKVP